MSGAVSVNAGGDAVAAGPFRLNTGNPPYSFTSDVFGVIVESSIHMLGSVASSIGVIEVWD